MLSCSGDAGVDDYGVEPSHPDPSNAPNFGSGGHTPVLVSTVFTTVYPTLMPPGGPSRITQVRPTPTLGPASGSPSGLVGGGIGGALPDEEFLVRTVLLSTMTVIHNGIENFKDEMEQKLTKAYRHAYVVRRYRREAAAPQEVPGWRRVGRRIRAALEEEEEKAIAEEELMEGGKDDAERTRQERADDDDDDKEWPTVKIHNIRSSLPEPEIEMIYTVSKGK